MRVLLLLPTYRTLADIGLQFGISRSTVKTHVEHIYLKLGATTRAEAVTIAQNAGLVPPQPIPAAPHCEHEHA